MFGKKNREPNRYIYGTAFLAEWRQEDSPEQWKIWRVKDGMVDDSPNFFTDSDEAAQKIIQMLDESVKTPKVAP